MVPSKIYRYILEKGRYSLLKNKKGIFNRFADAAFGIKRPESRRVSRDSILGSCNVIDADYIEIDEDSAPGSSRVSKSRETQNSRSVPDSEPVPNSESIDPELLDKLREYLKTRSPEEISEIFKEIGKILENRAAKGKSEYRSGDKFKREFNYSSDRRVPNKEKVNIRENLKSALRICSETASVGIERIIKLSKAASSTATSLAYDGKESIKVSSKMLNNKWNELSPRDRKIISEVIIALIEIGLLKGSSKGKKAAFAILSSISRHQTPGKNDLEEFVEGAQKIFKRGR